MPYMMRKALCRAILPVVCGVALMAAGGDVPFATGAVFGKAVPLDGAFCKGAMSVATEGDRLYVGGRGFVAVYDISSDPVRPRLLGRTEDIVSVRQLAVQDGLVCVVAREQGVWTVDCRDAAHPRVLGHLPSTSNCTGVDLAGNVCFVGGSRSGIDFVDISDPARPQLIRNVRQEPVESQSVAYRDGLLYSGEWGGKCVSVWNVRDMKAIRRLSLAKTASNGDGCWPVGRWLYAPTGWTSSDKSHTAPRPGQMGLEIFDIADPESPRRVSRLDFQYVKPGWLDMWLARSCGNLVFVAANCGGLYAVDVADKSAPRILDRWIAGGGKGKIAAEVRANGRLGKCVGALAPGEGVVYVAGPGLGGWVVPAKGAHREPPVRGTPPVNWSVRPPRPPVPEAFHRWLPSDASLTACVTGLAVRDDVCYAACGAAGLYVLELSGAGIREVKRLPLSECMDVAVAGNRLFVAAGREGFVGYEIVSPAELRPFMRMKSLGARDVYAYGDGTRWVSFNTTVHDISDPTAPKPLVSLVHQSRWNKFMCPDLIAGRWTSGNSSLKNFGWADLLADPVVETPIRGYASKGGAMCAFGEKAFIADGGKWAIVEPGSTEPPQMKPFPKGGCSRGLPRAKGPLVSLSGAGGTVGIWDFSDPEHPKHVRDYVFKVACDAVSFWRDRVVIPAREAGVLLPK